MINIKLALLATLFYNVKPSEVNPCPTELQDYRLGRDGHCYRIRDGYDQVDKLFSKYFDIGTCMALTDIAVKL